MNLFIDITDKSECNFFDLLMADLARFHPVYINWNNMIKGEIMFHVGVRILKNRRFGLKRVIYKEKQSK